MPPHDSSEVMSTPDFAAPADVLKGEERKEADALDDLTHVIEEANLSSPVARETAHEGPSQDPESKPAADSDTADEAQQYASHVRNASEDYSESLRDAVLREPGKSSIIEDESTIVSKAGEGSPPPSYEEATKESLLTLSGNDAMGRPIVLIDASQAPPPNERSAALKKLIEKLEPIVTGGPYVLVFALSPKYTAANHKQQIPTLWLLKAYRKLPRPYKKNVQKIVFIHPSLVLKAAFKFLTPLLSPKVHRKIVKVNRLSDLPVLTNSEIFLDQLKLAEHVFEYDRRQSSLSKTQSLTITGPEVALSTVNERDDTEAEHQDPPVVVVK
ncbi:hypothetical protein KFL_002080030 [Klebsormidium nitens]|uniref:CRAL-TRIO domain-containing protein n=1 Tax=Klebsormidium nitens TaxID=105231 RepID=A0A1Y1I814_KLENI|nr:hypothetical protein KFL_002080030 [Klebsormidium nitens]|eukprot:GAQ84826.1 hypothetical protein KFL_002080030 [Klebsormidium nitens]